MIVQAYFQNIKYHIFEELNASTNSIYVAVAWFTDLSLFNILCSKAKSGLDVQLIVVDDNITRACSIDYSKLVDAGGKLFLIDNETTGTLMHNKFCIIDGNVTITGSYNWSLKAQSNHENITITKESLDLAEMFTSEFKRIKIQYYGKDPLKKFDGAIICKRLTIIDNLIQLEEFSEIHNHKTKLVEYELSNEVINIICALENSDYTNCSLKIREYLIRMQSLTVFGEADLEQLKWQIKYLEIEIISLENEKSSIEKLISDFVHSYTIKFGELILKILNLKKERLAKEGKEKKSKEYEDAERSYKEKEKEINEEKDKNIEELNDTEKEELKQKYRKAVVLCHPDKFTDDETKAKAHKIFIELQDAYSKNDLNRIKEILEKLENGIYDIGESEKINKRESLIQRLNYLKERVALLNIQIEKYRKEKTYRNIISIKNMDTFFQEEKERLEAELKDIQNEQ